MIDTNVIQITKDDGSPAYIRVEPMYENDGNGEYFSNVYQLYQTDQDGHLHFTTMGIAPEIGENIPAMEDKDNADHLGALTFGKNGDNSAVYSGGMLSEKEQAQIKLQIQS